MRLLMIFFLSFLLVGCSDPASTDIRFGLANAPTNLDPRFATDAVSTRINRLLYERLVDFDEAAFPVPSLANWEKLSPLIYQFTLTPGEHRFHMQGQVLTAADVKATYESVLAESTASPHRGALTIIDKIEVRNDRQLLFYLRRADPLFPALLMIGILPARLLESQHDFAKMPIGSGPFQFVSNEGQGMIKIERVQDHQGVKFLHVPNATVRVLKLLRGELDLVQNDLPVELIQYVEKQPHIHSQTVPGSNFAYLGFNLQDPLMADVRIRKAIALAIDRKAIIHHLFNDHARLANALFPPEHWLGLDSQLQQAYNPEESRRLLAALGYGVEHPLTISYKTSNNGFRLRIASIIQAQLAQVGINLAIQSYDWGTFFGDIKAGRFQLFSLMWVGIKTPDMFRYAFHSKAAPPAGANRGRLANAEVDGLIEEAEAMTSLTEQAPIYQQLQRKLFADLPYVPLWYEDHVALWTDRISGYTLASDGNFDGLLQVQKRKLEAVADGQY